MKISTKQRRTGSTKVIEIVKHILVYISAVGAGFFAGITLGKDLSTNRYDTEKNNLVLRLSEAEKDIQRLTIRHVSDSLNYINLNTQRQLTYNIINNLPSDLPTLTVANSNLTPNIAGFWVGNWKVETDARIGDTISVQIYYHNSGVGVAKNVAVGIRDSSFTVDDVHIIYGGILVDGWTAKLGSIGVRLESPAALKFIPGSIRWYKQQGKNLINVGKEFEGKLFTNYGLMLGDVDPGINNQGVVVCDYQIAER